MKSLITHPANGTDLRDREVQVRGHAWSGERSIASVDLSYDFGTTWQKASLDSPVNEGAWQDFRLDVSLPMDGYYEIWARASDSEGAAQPHAIAWNQKGYLNNAMHRVGIRVA